MLPSGSPTSPKPMGELNFESLKQGIDTSIGIMSSFESLPRDLKVYRDPNSGEMVPSAKPVVQFIERMKSPDGSRPYKDNLLNWVSWGSQVATRMYYRQDFKDTVRDLQMIDRQIFGSLQLIDARVDMEEMPLSLEELRALKTNIEKLSGKIDAADRIATIYEKNVKPEKNEVESKKDTINKSVNQFKKDLKDQIELSLNKLTTKIAQFNQPQQPTPSPSPTLPTPPTRTPSPESPPHITVVEESPILQPQPIKIEGIVSPVETEPTSPPPSPPSQAMREVEDVSQPIDISKEVQSPSSQSISAAEEKRLESFKFEGVSLKDVLDKMTPEGIFCMMRVVNNFWLHRVHASNPLLPETDPVVRRLAPLKFNGKSLRENLEPLPMKDLIILKNCLVKFWYTHGIRKH